MLFVFRCDITDIILFTTDMVVLLITVKKYNIIVPLTRTDAVLFVCSVSTHRHVPGLSQY
jgi:hypothetical protein